MTKRNSNHRKGHRRPKKDYPQQPSQQEEQNDIVEESLELEQDSEVDTPEETTPENLDCQCEEVLSEEAVEDVAAVEEVEVSIEQKKSKKAWWLLLPIVVAGAGFAGYQYTQSQKVAQATSPVVVDESVASVDDATQDSASVAETVDTVSSEEVDAKATEEKSVVNEIPQDEPKTDSETQVATEKPPVSADETATDTQSDIETAAPVTDMVSSEGKEQPEVDVVTQETKTEEVKVASDESVTTEKSVDHKEVNTDSPVVENESDTAIATVKEVVSSEDAVSNEPLVNDQEVTPKIEDTQEVVSEHEIESALQQPVSEEAPTVAPVDVVDVVETKEPVTQEPVEDASSVSDVSKDVQETTTVSDSVKEDTSELPMEQAVTQESASVEENASVEVASNTQDKEIGVDEQKSVQDVVPQPDKGQNDVVVDTSKSSLEVTRLSEELASLKQAMIIKDERIKLLEQSSKNDVVRMEDLLEQMKQYVLSAKREVGMGRVDLSLNSLQAARNTVAFLQESYQAPLNHALDKNEAEVKALNAFDYDVLYTQLETLEQALSKLSIEVQPVPTDVSQTATTSESDNEASDWWSRLQALPEQTADFLQSDMRGLVRVEEVRSDVAIMSNEQLAVIKERMKLEVAMLKHALISHRPSLWDRTIQSLNGMLGQYFSNEQASVKSVKSQLDDLSKVSIRFEVKAFEQTLSVIRQTQAELGKE